MESAMARIPKYSFLLSFVVKVLLHQLKRKTKSVHLAHPMVNAEFLEFPSLIFGDLEVQVRQFLLFIRHFALR
jgi:hypothetical protein